MNDYLEKIREKTGFNPLYLLGGIACAILLVFLGKSEEYLTILSGIIYPFYMSMKAIESPDENDDKQWCTYWVIFFLFRLLELYLGFILHLIPFYFLAKLVFLVWLFFPTTSGATVVYEKFLSKIFAKYEKDLDSLVDDVGKSVTRGYDTAKQQVKDNSAQLITGAVSAASKLNN